MSRKSIVVADVLLEFRNSKQVQFSTEAARDNIIPTDVSKKNPKQIQPKADGCFCLKVICF